MTQRLTDVDALIEKINRRPIPQDMDFPYRKKKGLGIYDYHSNAYVKVATFNNEESAECFMEYLAKFVGARLDV